MKFAHSLGYPHYDLMLGDMTASQVVEVYTYFRLEEQQQEQSRLDREELNIERFFELAEARQRQVKRLKAQG